MKTFTTPLRRPSVAAGPLALVAVLLLLPLVAHAQTVDPLEINLDEDAPVCTGESQDLDVQITRPTEAAVDVLLLFDDTGSFASNAEDLIDRFPDLVANLQGDLPGVDFGFGVARFEDYGGPGADFGGLDNQSRPFLLNQPIITQEDAMDAGTDLNTLITDALEREAPANGGDSPESAIAEGLLQAVTGVGFDGNGDGDTEDSGNAGEVDTQINPGSSGDVPAFASNVLPASGTEGGVGFRASAQKLIILATDICSIAAFDSEEGVPEEIVNAEGDAEPTTAFACSSFFGEATLGEERYGFVSDAKSLADNTIEDAVVPSEAGIVQQVIDALNAQGVQVLGLNNAGGRTSETNPSSGPAVFQSALARLTGAVNDAGEELVFDLGTSDDDLVAAIADAVTGAVDEEIDLTLSTTELPEGLSFGFSPELVEDVAPTQTAMFTTTLMGDGSSLMGNFAIQFLNAESGAVQGSIPVSVDCGMPPPPPMGGLVINEFLADPDGSVDANGDGAVDNTDDEFVELFNPTGDPIDASGYTLTDEAGGTYTFPDGTVIEPGEGAVIFGGGSPTGFFVFTGTGLPELDDSGDTITLADAEGTTVDEASYGDGDASGVSLARNENGEGPFEAQDTFGPMTSDTAGLNNNDGDALPVEFAGAPSARVEGRAVVLSWQTLTETGNAGFYAEYRRAEAEAADWQTANPDARVASKAPSGTSSEALSYSYRVSDLTPGRYVFRVRQVDRDGAEGYSAVSTEAEVGAAGFALQSPYPNPVRSTATLEYSAPENADVTASLYDALGQRVRTLEAVGGQVRVEAQGLASGLYFVRLQAGDRAASQSITIVR